VDDSLSVRKVVEKALAGRSVQVLSAASGTEAMERIERDRPDVVVCDVILPDKDGYQVCRFVREHPTIGRTPVLLISGVVNSTVLARAAEVQSNDVMFKPFAAEELVRKIDAMLSPHVPVGNGNLTLIGAGQLAVTPLAPPLAAPRAIESAPITPAPIASATPEPTLSTPEPGGDSLKARLLFLAGAPGVSFVALADREGFLIESAGEAAAEAEVAGALTSYLAESSEALGRELGRGALQSAIFEYEGGVVLLHNVGPTALLAIALGDPAALGKVRYFVKKALPELERAL
jgi:CheY-like chemotaxis protein